MTPNLKGMMEVKLWKCSLLCSHLVFHVFLSCIVVVIKYCNCLIWQRNLAIEAVKNESTLIWFGFDCGFWIAWWLSPYFLSSFSFTVQWELCIKARSKGHCVVCHYKCYFPVTPRTPPPSTPPRCFQWRAEGPGQGGDGAPFLEVASLEKWRRRLHEGMCPLSWWWGFWGMQATPSSISPWCWNWDSFQKWLILTRKLCSGWECRDGSFRLRSDR